MKRIIFGATLILIVTVINFYRDDIIDFYKLYMFKKDVPVVTDNQYTKTYKYKYVSRHDELELASNQNILDSVFTFLNTGTTNMGRYCLRTYLDCIKDVKTIANDNNLLSHINDFVHPYNSFKDITFSIDDFIVSFESTKIYSEAKISKMEEKINKIISDNITSSMSDKDKIKVIHDYIINNTKYDILKTQNINDTTYESNTAYGVLFEGYGTCSGYSDLMAIFLTKFNILNYKISNETHIWNLVYLDGKWLHLDLTWDDPVTYNGKDLLKYDYFLINSDQLSKMDDSDHEFDKNIYLEA